MIERLIDLSAKYRWGVVLFFTLAALGAGAAARRVQVDAIPDLSDDHLSQRSVVASCPPTRLLMTARGDGCAVKQRERNRFKPLEGHRTANGSHRVGGEGKSWR